MSLESLAKAMMKKIEWNATEKREEVKELVTTTV